MTERRSKDLDHPVGDAKQPKGSSGRPAATLILCVLAAVLAWWLTQPPVAAPAPAAAPRTSPVVVAHEPPATMPEAPVLAATATLRPKIAAGFCAPEGEDGTITLHRTLIGLAYNEAERRLAALSPGEQDAAKQAAKALQADGTVPEGPTAVASLLIAAREHTAAVRLLGAADRVSGAWPADPYPQVVRAMAATTLGRTAVRLEALRAAWRGLPKDAAIGWNLYQQLRDTPELDEALAGIDAYLQVDPAVPIARMRALLEVQRDIQKPYRRRESGGVVLLWPASAISDRQADALLSAVQAALDDAARLTRTERRAQLTVVVYPGHEELLAVACVQTWAGALYDGTLRLVAAPDQPAGAELIQLRHESLHAQLSPLAPQAPKWFHEGVAQSFAGEGQWVRPAWALLVRNRNWIPFASLDGSFQVFEKGSDANLAYAESLALVDYLRETAGEGAIAEALRAFREGADTPTALARASHRAEVTGADLLEYLARRLAEPVR